MGDCINEYILDGHGKYFYGKFCHCSTNRLSTGLAFEGSVSTRQGAQ